MSDTEEPLEKEKERKKRNERILNKQNEEQMEGLLILLLAFFGVNKVDAASDPSLDDSESLLNDRNVISAFSIAVGLDENEIKRTVSDVRSGKIDVRTAAENTLNKIDTTSVTWQSANKKLGELTELNDLPHSGSAKFETAVSIILKLEGGWNPNEPDGGVANHGINSIANPDIDVKNLSELNAIKLYRVRYWDKVPGIENFDQRAATAIFDLAVNSGPGRANQFLKQLETEGKANIKEGTIDLDAFMEKRAQFYDRLIEKNPTKYAQYETGWDARLEHLTSAIEQIPAQSPSLIASAETVRDNNPVTTTVTETFATGGTDKIAAKTIDPATDGATTAFTHDILTKGGTNEIETVAGLDAANEADAGITGLLSDNSLNTALGIGGAKG